MKKEIFVVGAIIIRDKKILCCQRGEGRSLSNLWEFPGGKIEKNESTAEALERELMEELQVQVEISEHLFESTTYEYDFGIVTLKTYICHLKTGEPVLTEHIQSKWLSTNQLDQLDWAPADIPAVQKLIQQGICDE
ncbi:(deoxy)nucleoside triphosphate pyrophosphohydrolase [Enterococcus raffinosus]|uniref:(deoxy)nucleoside triphosphate pyrophosphohydrolase n=1 Tax=Enterococcus raffinosus TaxID=71452 RepID=UPI001C46AE9E|nr:(deoxy)nucleoside triphosphate pyrophosphohydrolase [Enterococcus raffinosus]MDT2572036.1 (deoxy)nucleoside triphosphate pyrophosphohydrolase [Enterococcus raffinosus]QXJ59160.1 (deoxy)nucleoside triphosphate pyrophosphohydrolase [Enterococcus raffinosus]